MLTYQELKSSLAIGDDGPSLKPLWALTRDNDRAAAMELLWKLLEDENTSELVRFASTIYLGYMGDSRVLERLRLGCTSSTSVQNLGYVVALANLNELDALLLLRDKLMSPEDEFSTLRILGSTRNCSNFEGCDDTSQLVSRINELVLSLESSSVRQSESQ